MGKILNIPAHHGFAQALVFGLLGRSDPFALAKTQIYLPTRRSVRTVQLAFAELAKDHPLLLPRLFAVGDLDADELLLAGHNDMALEDLRVPPAMAQSQRLFLLARLIDHAWDQVLSSAQPKSTTQVFAYARALTSLLDTIETEGLDLSVLSQAAPTDPELEGFWERAGRFIALIQDVWPNLEHETGQISAARRRRLLLELQIREWLQGPPDHPVILAGTTATIPAVTDLARVIAGLPKGRVVLPGLDVHLDTPTWDLVLDSPTHPQHGMAQLLHKLDVPPNHVELWPGCHGATNLDRHAAISFAQRPVGATVFAPSKSFDLSNLALAEAPSPELEARAIAIFLRKALENPTATAALVTPDQDLAGRVKAELQRWRIEVDESSGLPLLESTAGRLVQISSYCLGCHISALSLTSLLTHPLVTWDVDKANLARAYGHIMDRKTRGIGTFKHPDDVDWPDHPLSNQLRTFWQQSPDQPQPLDLWVKRHLTFLTTLCPNPEHLWTGPSGEGLSLLFEELQTHSSLLPPLSVGDYQELLASFLYESTFHQTYENRPKVAILGTLEARLLKVDALALGGLNEGTWPKETDVGPWMNRPTRAHIGLPSPERKVGLAAHDLAQAFGSDTLLMTRTTRVDGTPTLPCRWVERLKTLAERSGQADALMAEGDLYVHWAHMLDQRDTTHPALPTRPASACPPGFARPQILYATDIGLLVTNPYAFYAKRILRLRPLPARGAQPFEQVWGTLVHGILDAAVRDGLKDLSALHVLGSEYLHRLKIDSSLASLWQTQLTHCLTQFWSLNTPYTAYESATEVEGQMSVSNTMILGRADRVVQQPDKIQIIDYKTGQAPGAKDQIQGIDPQLTVLGLIADSRGFDGFVGDRVGQSFMVLPKQAHKQGKEKVICTSVHEDVMAGLQTLLQAYADPTQPYLSAPFGDKIGKADPKYDDYTHLARRITA